MRFGEVLDFLLESGFGNQWRPWKVERFGQRLGVASSTVYLWKRGRRCRPRAENLHNMAELLELDPFFTSLLFQSVEGISEVTAEELVWRRDQLRYAENTHRDPPDWVVERCPHHDGIPLRPASSEHIRWLLGVDKPVAGEDWLELVWAYGRAFRVSHPTTLLPSMLVDLTELSKEVVAQGRGCEPCPRREARALLTGLVALAYMEAYPFPEGLRWWRSAEQAAHGTTPFAESWVMSRYAIEQLHTFQSMEEAWPRAAAAAKVEGKEWGGACGVLAMVAARNGRTEEAQHQLAKAKALLAQSSIQVAGRDSVFGWSEADLWYVESYVYTHTKQIEAAQKAQYHARKLLGKSVSCWIYRALIEIHEATILVVTEAVEEGCEMACLTISWAAAMEEIYASLVPGSTASLVPPLRTHRWLRASLFELLAMVPSKNQDQASVLALVQMI